MAPYLLLNPSIDIKYQAKHVEDGHELPVLVTRTPKSDWMIHPDWTDRLAWARLLPLARMVEAAREWVPVPAFEVGGEDLDQYREKHKRFGYDKSLLTCLVDRWRPETHTLHFPWERWRLLSRMSFFPLIPAFLQFSPKI